MVEYVWKVRSTPSPDEILRTMKFEFKPRLRFAITTPSNACTRLRSPSTTLTLTTTVSPAANSGISLPKRAISSCSNCSIKFTLLLLAFSYQNLVPSGTLPEAQTPLLSDRTRPIIQACATTFCPTTAEAANALYRHDCRIAAPGARLHH